jgi:inosine-uridine nucleoside N-ribohydrolase
MLQELMVVLEVTEEMLVTEEMEERLVRAEQVVTRALQPMLQTEVHYMLADS